MGYNCAECVTEAVLTFVETGLPPEVKKMATGFGGGVGLFGDTCGAVAGAAGVAARELGFVRFSTTLTVSPYQRHDLIVAAGEAAADANGAAQTFS